MASNTSSQPIRALKSAVDRMFHSRISLSDLLRAIYFFAVSLFFLPINTLILLTTALLNAAHLLPNSGRDQRQRLLRNPHFYPKTVLITGIGTARGLALARQFHYGGHRVVGVDVGLLAVRSGGSMSNAVHCCHVLSKKRYVPGLLDIINREKVDLWITCSDRVAPLEDSMAKSAIESRTSCKCIHFNTDYAFLFSQDENFLQHVSERGLPVFERHHVRSRDSVHRILNRSPDKTYVMQTHTKGPSRNSLTLPRRTPSQTYSDISELQISQDQPWVLKQRARTGKFWADIVFVQGQVKVLKLRPTHYKADWENTSLNNGVTEVTRQIMERFAEKGASRMSGHLSVKLVVDEEIKSNSVCYTVFLAGCRQGTAASALLVDPPPHLYRQYLEILPTTGDVVAEESNDRSFPDKAGLLRMSCRYFVGQQRQRSANIAALAEKVGRKLERVWSPVTTTISYLAHESCLLEVWTQSLFSMIDPLPWWWNIHISRPLDGIAMMLGGTCEAPVKRKKARS